MKGLTRRVFFLVNHKEDSKISRDFVRTKIESFIWNVLILFFIQRFPIVRELKKGVNRKKTQKYFCEFVRFIFVVFFCGE